MTQGRPLRVVESFREPTGTTNPYIVMLYRALGSTPGLVVRPFSWRTALLGRYDVFHVHWPEVRLAGRTWPVRLMRHFLMALLLIRLRLLRVPIVRTRHNLSRPTGIARMTNLLLAWLERETAHEIVLNGTGIDPGDNTVTVVPHGHYRDWFDGAAKAKARESHFAYFGLVRTYKGLTGLVRAFRSLPEGYSLTIAGNPSRDQLVSELNHAREGDPRVTFDFRFLPDHDLVRVATEGRLVVLPYLEMHNSGGVLAALSLDRPVLVPDNDVNRDLAREVGEGWVMRYRGALDAAVLRDAMAAARAIKVGDRPDLAGRDWDTCGRLHLEAFRRAGSALRRRA